MLLSIDYASRSFVLLVHTLTLSRPNSLIQRSICIKYVLFPTCEKYGFSSKKSPGLHLRRWDIAVIGLLFLWPTLELPRISKKSTPHRDKVTRSHKHYEEIQNEPVCFVLDDRTIKQISPRALSTCMIAVKGRGLFGVPHTWQKLEAHRAESGGKQSQRQKQTRVQHERRQPRKCTENKEPWRVTTEQPINTALSNQGDGGPCNHRG